MFRIFQLIFLWILVLAIPGYAATQLKDEGTSQGYVNILNCTGVGISCSKSGITGTVNVGGGGGASITVEEGDVTVDATATDLDFSANDFSVTSSPAGEANISLDYTNGQASSGSLKGFLTSTDWTTFNNKQSAITWGAGLTISGAISSTASSEADFLTSGALTCGASTQGKMQVHTTPLQYCDNAATPALQYAAYGNSSGVATSATALAANGSNCAAGNYPLGVDASGAAESCTADTGAGTNATALTWNVTPATCTGDGNSGALTVNGTNQIVCSADDGGAGGGGDNITVNAAAATDANLLDNLYIDWGLNTATTPDDVTAKFNYAETLAGNPALLTTECVFTGDGILCEGTTADTIEMKLAFPDPATTDKTLTFPNETGTVCSTGSVCTGYQAGPLTGDVTTSGAAATIAADSVALTTDTTGSYAAGDAEAGAALTGDTATAFFSLGSIERARGGLAADTSAYGAGLIGSDATNVTIDVDTEAELETALGGLDVVTVTASDITSANLATALSDETGTGVAVFGTSPRLTTSLLDSNGNAFLKITATASAVNEFTIANAATTADPVLSVTGTDTNIDLALTAKGTGGVIVTSTNTGPSTITHGLTVNNDGVSTVAGDDFVVKGDLQDTLFVVDASEDDVELGGLVETTGTAPTLSACGTSPSVTATATDMGGKITVGTAAADTCTLTFNQTWAVAPSCSVTGSDPANVIAATTTTTTLVITTPAASDFSSNVLMYNCFGQE